MANPLPPGHIVDLHEDEPVHPEPVHIILNHAPLCPEEEPEPEPEPAFAPFTQAAQHNMNGWLEEDDEDEMEVEEDDEMDDEIEDDGDDAKIINPYVEVDHLNRPPPDLDTEPEAVTAAPVGHATMQLLPPICRFSGTFYVGEGSLATAFTAENCKVSAPGPLGKNFGAFHSKVKTLTKQIKDSFDDDLSTLDMTLREEMLKLSKMVQLVKDLSRQF
ncbi:hypothetical protein Tco_0679312 [Tanacetum coccineum]|uniref:Uncharacterized protein n=1 Tax=Tanacetum coccineum TaxID=301880 RepID=A0ABQ4XIF3_9ASTR